MTPELRKIKIGELRKFHAPNMLGLIGNDSWYFTAKCPHIPEGKDDKHIGLFESEVTVGDDVYIELVTMDYTPIDQSRTLYKWVFDPNCKQKYSIKKGQFMIPVHDLRYVYKAEGHIATELHTQTTSPLKILYPSINGIYEHYKGGRYKVLLLAPHTETKDILVIYQSLHFGSYHARPLSQWFEIIKDSNVQRFKFINHG